MTQGPLGDEVCKAEHEGRMLNQYLGESKQFLIIPGLIVQAEDNPDLMTFLLSPPSLLRRQEVAEYGQRGKCNLPI